MNSPDIQQFVADLVRRLLQEEGRPRRCKILPFPKKPKPRPERELRQLLDEQADKA